MFDLKYIFLLFIGVGILLFGVVYVLEYLNFAKTGNGKYNFLRYFPFELNCFKRNQKVSYFYALASLFAAIFFSASFLSFAFAVTNNGGATIVAYIMFAISLITGFIFYFLTFIKLSNYTMHLIFAVILLCLNLLQLLLELFFLPNSNYFFINVANQGTQISLFVIVFLMLIFEAVLMFNPAYKRWNKMVKVDAETFNRPRFNYLAMLEWGNFLVYILTALPIGITFFF